VEKTGVKKGGWKTDSIVEAEVLGRNPREKKGFDSALWKGKK